MLAVAIATLLATAIGSFWLGQHRTSSPVREAPSPQPGALNATAAAWTAPQPDRRVIAEEPLVPDYPKPERTQTESMRCVSQSMSTGDRIQNDFGLGGHGVLTIENGTDQDAVVRMFQPFANDATVRWFFVTAHTSARITQIPEGTFGVRFTTGQGWQPSKLEFCKHPSYQEFSKELTFAEEQEPDGVKYLEMSLTLQPVHDGNVHTTGISKEKFLKGAYVPSLSPLTQVQQDESKTPTSH